MNKNVLLAFEFFGINVKSKDDAFMLNIVEKLTSDYPDFKAKYTYNGKFLKSINDILFLGFSRTNA